MTRPEWTYRTGEDGKAKPPPEGWPSWAAFAEAESEDWA